MEMKHGRLAQLCQVLTVREYGFDFRQINEGAFRTVAGKFSKGRLQGHLPIARAENYHTFQRGDFCCCFMSLRQSPLCVFASLCKLGELITRLLCIFANFPASQNSKTNRSRKVHMLNNLNGYYFI